jgi:hypothetical protein
MLEGEENFIHYFVRKPARCKWEDAIEMDVKEVGCEDLVWIHPAQDKVQRQDLVNTVMKISGYIKYFFL